MYAAINVNVVTRAQSIHALSYYVTHYCMLIFVFLDLAYKCTYCTVTFDYYCCCVLDLGSLARSHLASI